MKTLSHEKIERLIEGSRLVFESLENEIDDNTEDREDTSIAWNDYVREFFSHYLSVDEFDALYGSYEYEEEYYYTIDWENVHKQLSKMKRERLSF